MYVCMYVCMYDVCMYVCMMYACILSLKHMLLFPLLYNVKLPQNLILFVCFCVPLHCEDYTTALSRDSISDE